VPADVSKQANVNFSCPAYIQEQQYFQYWVLKPFLGSTAGLRAWVLKQFLGSTAGLSSQAIAGLGSQAIAVLKLVVAVLFLRLCRRRLNLAT
jgi:hypothetical protein